MSREWKGESREDRAEASGRDRVWERAIKKVGRADGGGSMNKVTCRLARWSEFHPQNLQGGRRGLTPKSCPLTFSSIMGRTPTRTHTHIHQYIKRDSYKVSSRLGELSGKELV